MATYEKRLGVGNTDTYTHTIEPSWLGEETIASHVVTVDGVKLQKNSSGVTGNAIGVSLTALMSGGNQVHFEWETSGGRSDCANNILICIDGC